MPNQIGSALSSTLSRRAPSCAGDVMDGGNSMLSSKHLEMLTVLPINRKFMEFMRTHYLTSRGTPSR